MKYTKNYRLPQWVKDDRIMMEDFNAMNASIENGLTRTEGKADAAVSTANAAKQTADAAAVARPYAVGTYTGAGTTDLHITLGFRPSFLIISGMRDTSIPTSPELWTYHFGLTGGTAVSNRVTFTDNGFTVHSQSTAHNEYPNYDEKDRVYDYIAFR